MDSSRSPSRSVVDLGCDDNLCEYADLDLNCEAALQEIASLAALMSGTPIPVTMSKPVPAE